MRKTNERRADGRLQSKIYIGKDASGKQKYKYVYASTQKELDKKVAELKLKLGKGVDIAAERDATTFGYWRRYYLNFKKASVSEKWYHTLLSNSKWLEKLDNVPIVKLRKADLVTIMLEMSSAVSSATGKPYTQKTMKSVKELACGIMIEACENRVIEFNPFERVQVPDGRPPDERRALTSEEQEWVKNTPHRAQTPAMIMMYAGLRRGELIPLTWDKIDLENAQITVNTFVEIKKGQASQKSEGKSEYAPRVVDIPKILVEYLRGIQREGFLVAPAPNGKMMSESSWKRMWESYLSVLNFKYGKFDNIIKDGKKFEKPKSRFAPGGVPMIIPQFTAHWLRHTFITNMYLAGVDVLTAQQQAGHASVQTTLGIYTHLDKIHKKKSIEKLDDFFAEKSS